MYLLSLARHAWALRPPRLAAAALLMCLFAFPAFGVSPSIAVADEIIWVIKIKWTAPGDDGMTGTAAAYDIRYSLNSITEANWAQATSAVGVPSPSPARSTDSFTVKGLLSQTVYYVAVKARDEANNWSGISNVISKESVPTLVTGIEDSTQGIRPFSTGTRQNFPNPFNGGTTIEYSLSSPSGIRIDIFNSLGRHIQTLVDRQMPAGVHTVHWDGTNRQGEPVASGVYFYRLVAGSHMQTRQMTLLK